MRIKELVLAAMQHHISAVPVHCREEMGIERPLHASKTRTMVKNAGLLIPMPRKCIAFEPNLFPFLGTCVLARERR